MLKYPCPQCDHALSIQERLPGKLVRCRKCRAQFIVPRTLEPALVGYTGSPVQADLLLSDLEGPMGIGSASPAPLDPAIARTCPTCGHQVDVRNKWADVICIVCGADVPGISDRTTGQGTPSARKNAHQPTPIRPKANSLIHIVLAPFNVDVLAKAFVQAVVLLAAFVGVIVCILGIVTAPLALAVGVAAWLWLWQRDMGVVAQYASGRFMNLAERSKLGCVGQVLVVHVVALAGGALLAGIAAGPWGTEQGLPIALVVLLAVLFLYVPMGIAMAAAYEILNPAKVVKKIIDIFPAYLLSLVCFGAFFALVYGLALILGAIGLGTKVATSIAETLAPVGWTFDSLLSVALGQYGLVAYFAMLGTLLRRHEQAPAETYA